MLHSAKKKRVRDELTDERANEGGRGAFARIRLVGDHSEKTGDQDRTSKGKIQKVKTKKIWKSGCAVERRMEKDGGLSCRM